MASNQWNTSYLEFMHYLTMTNCMLIIGLFFFLSLVQRPPSQSLNSYGHSVHDDVRSPTGSTGTPGPLSQQPSSQQSTDNNSEAGKL